MNGVASQMKSFDYFFGACLLHLLFQHTDHLSKTLPYTKISVTEGQVIAGMTMQIMQVSFVVFIKIFLTKYLSSLGDLKIFSSNGGKNREICL